MKKILIPLIICVLMFGFIIVYKGNAKKGEKTMERPKVDLSSIKNKGEIYLAGGCFWGVEGYYSKIEGILDTTVGYANGNGTDTNYKKIKSTDHSETVHIIYDKDIISLEEILQHYFRIIEPTSVNRQGNDIGRQYRTGIYFVDENDKSIIEKFIDSQRANYDKPITVEVEN